MFAMVLRKVGGPLEPEERPLPIPGPGEVRVRVKACAVCRTDLHLVEGELSDLTLPVVPGHEVVGVVEALGEGVCRLWVGQRVGVPWLGWTCGTCASCRSGRENLCPHARFTGWQRDGGFAEALVADARFCFPLPEGPSDAELAPLMCAGLIGFRTLRFAGDAHRLGLYGFGAAAHLVAQVARHQGREVYAFTRPQDTSAQRFARQLGAVWAGDSTQDAPVPLDAALLFAPVGALVPQALRQVCPGGTVVCGGIHMSDIPSFPYAWLWGERTVRSVANLTRKDAEAFLDLARTLPLEVHVQRYPLREASLALEDLRRGRVQGAAVLIPEGT